MHVFRVWAPRPRKVELEVGGEVIQMAPEKSGWWSASVHHALPGNRYGFVLDGEGPFPDPRSPCQPDGVHGLSALVNETNFAWSDQTFRAPALRDALIYELHLGTFTPAGNFLAAIEKLNHLVSLGVTHVELMPVVEFPGNHGWGYDGVDLFAPHHAYGTPNDLKCLVDACHARGLAVILDVVYNHLGPSGNYLAKFGPYFSRRFATFWGEGINFDGEDSGEVRRFFCDNALMWLRDYHFDGLRLDAVHGIVDTSAVHILEQLKIEVEDLAARSGRNLVLIPESDLNDPRLLSPRARGGYELDAQWSDDFHHALHVALTGEKIGYYSDFGGFKDLAKSLQHAYVYDGQYSRHRRRVHGRPAVELDGRRFLAYLQNHDQVGNRAHGDRSSQLMTPGRLKIAAALVLTSPFIPMLFQGEEWGASTPFQYFTEYGEPELANAVGEGRCREFAAFGWNIENIPDPQAPETFEQSKLNWRELSEPAHDDILKWHRQLVQLRRSEPDLADGDLSAISTRFDDREGWLVVQRRTLSIVCNLSPSPRKIPSGGGELRVLVASDPAIRIESGQVELPPDSVVICKAAR